MKKARAYNKSRSIIIIHDTKLCSIFEIEDDDADDDGEMIMVNAQRRMQWMCSRVCEHRKYTVAFN